MLDHLLSAEKALEVAARDFDPSTCSGAEAVSLLEELGVQLRLIDGMIAKVAKQIEDTAESTRRREQECL